MYHNSLKFFPTHKQSKSQTTNFKILFISFILFSSTENLHVKCDIIFNEKIWSLHLYFLQRFICEFDAIRNQTNIME